MDPDTHCAAQLVERIDCTEDLAIFRFAPEEPLDFTPGQYATLGIEDENRGRLLQRPYSVASSPHEDTLDFFIELVEDGALTSQLWTLDLGATCFVRRRIVGRFVLDREDGRPHHLMAATVTGVAPYISIVRALRHAVGNGTPAGDVPRLLILHGASRPAEFGPYRDELTSLAHTADWLRYVPTISRPWEAPAWPGETGRVEDVLRKHMDAADFTAENAAAYACGHPQMIEKAKAILTRTGFAKDHMHEEKYFRESSTPPKASVPDPSRLPPSA